MKNEKLDFKNCYKRSIIYETWCNTCLKEGGHEDMVDNVENIIDCPENESGEDTVVVDTTPDEDTENVNVYVKNIADHQKKRKLVSDTRERHRFRYIGETSRSVFARGGAPKRFGVQATKIAHFEKLFDEAPKNGSR